MLSFSTEDLEKNTKDFFEQIANCDDFEKQLEGYVQTWKKAHDFYKLHSENFDYKTEFYHHNPSDSSEILDTLLCIYFQKNGDYDILNSIVSETNAKIINDKNPKTTKADRNQEHSLKNDKISSRAENKTNLKSLHLKYNAFKSDSFDEKPKDREDQNFHSETSDLGPPVSDDNRQFVKNSTLHFINQSKICKPVEKRPIFTMDHNDTYHTYQNITTITKKTPESTPVSTIHEKYPEYFDPYCFQRKTPFKINRQLLQKYTDVEIYLSEIRQNKYDRVISAISKMPFPKFRSRFISQMNEILFKTAIVNGRNLEAIELARKSRQDGYQIQRLSDLMSKDVTGMKKKCEKLKNTLINSFSSYYCTIHKIPQKTTFEKLVLAGHIALETFKEPSIKFQMSTTEPDDVWSEITINYPLDEIYHSVFICPVLKKYCGSDNVPCILICGHIISKEAVDNLVKMDQNEEIKCPYCPYMSKLTDIKEIKLCI